MKQILFSFIAAGALFLASCGATDTNKETSKDSVSEVKTSSETLENRLFRVENADGEQGYANAKGDTVIAIGKYMICFTDTFTNVAIVLEPSTGYIAIDKKETVLYEVFPFDNGPDYPSEGLFRIIKNEKIGYADEDGKIVIEPQFSCAYPFEDGKAKVTMNCTVKQEDEHNIWESKEWYYIDKSGNKVK